MSFRGMPPVVYAPTFTDDAGQERVMMYEMPDGRVALFVYSAIDRLEEQYGAGSPWALMAPTHLRRALEEAPFDLLLLDHPRQSPGAVPWAS